MDIKTIKIADKEVNTGETFIIAEAGLNHNGNLDTALTLVKEAALAGADAVKFQTFQTDQLVLDKPENKELTELFSSLELSFSEFKKIKEKAESLGIIFLSTPFDFQSLRFLAELNVSAIKIASADITHHPLLKRAADTGLPIILSTGMADLEEIRSAIQVIERAGNKQIILLHATISHPAPLDNLNLNAMDSLKTFGYPIGYSDHTENMLVPCLAIAKGASVIEKHFTLDKKMDGPDHAHSINPEELKSLVTQIRETERILGDTIKKTYSVETKTKKVARRSIVSMDTIPKETTITEEMLTYKRPGTGISPANLEEVLGKKTITEIQKDTILEKSFWEK